MSFFNDVSHIVVRFITSIGNVNSWNGRLISIDHCNKSTMFVPLFTALYNGIGINSSLKIVKGIQVEKVVRFLPICSFMIRAGFIFIRCLVTTSVEQARWALILCIETVKLSLSQKDYYVLLRFPF